jgi:hypothetical protein
MAHTELKYEDGHGGQIVQWIVSDEGIEIYLQIVEPKSAVKKFLVRIDHPNYTMLSSTVLLAVSKGSNIRVFTRNNTGETVRAIVGYL